MRSNVLKASLAGVAAVALLAGGTTYASWSDFHVDQGNTVGAGTLTLVAGEQAGNGPTSQFDNVRLAPGEDKDEWVKIVSNNGDSVPNGILSVDVVDYVGTEDGCAGNSEVLLDADCADLASGGEFDRWARFQVTAFRIADQGQACSDVVIGDPWFNNRAQYTAIARQRMDQAVALDAMDFVDADGDPVVLGPGNALCVGAAAFMPQNATNAAQGDSADFSLRFDLVQTDLPIN
ncbi:SipW-dependent-type signal peptide-containing protein [Jannaschia sp. R86511]|uniref:SipW-dependent-type signal peptide-containing protein n=1 Tax=Jannaschia sp. R86511 TaxID=3093853 RepID=UPI0036D3BB3C